MKVGAGITFVWWPSTFNNYSREGSEGCPSRLNFSQFKDFPHAPDVLSVPPLAA